MPWTFEITTGRLFDPAGTEVSRGYAGGNCGKNPEGRNNPDLCNVPNIGPLPPGFYTYGEPIEHSKLGAFAIPLIPDPANEMYDRKDFFMHGDTPIPGNGSEGCIVQPRPWREAAHKSPDQRIQVVR